MIKKYICLFVLLILFVSFTGYSQVGIETDSPKGALDINSSTTGLVYPVVALTGINTQTITNPNGANLVAGTTVYNTATVNDGSNSVYPGIYVWKGTEWTAQFNKNDYTLFEQKNNLRTASNYGNEDVVFNNNSFTPKYNGLYKIKLTVHYGGGETNVPPGQYQYVNFVATAGEFKYNDNHGTSSTFTVKSYTAKNYDSNVNGNVYVKKYIKQYRQTSFIIEKTLTATTNYQFSLKFNQEYLPGIINFGNYNNVNNYSFAGLGYINIEDNLKCTVEVNYVGK